MNTVQLAMARSLPRDLLELTKPRLSSLVMISAGVGMMLAPAGAPNWQRAVVALFAIATAVGGANALNCYLERDLDALMKRTRARALPTGRLEPGVALVFGVAMSVAGVAVLAVISTLAAVLAAIAVVSYVLVYTPLKRRSSLCTLVGAVPGAIPPMIGWVAASGQLDAGAWLLFAWLFLWQPPHFYALATIYEEDYRAAGMPMLTVVHPQGGIVERQMVLFTALMIPVPLLLVTVGRAGTLTLLVAPLLGLAFLGVVLRQWFRGTKPSSARATFTASIVYLFLVQLVLVLDAGASG